MTVVSTRTRWQQLAALDGLVSEKTGRTLAELAARVPTDDAIVEIGSYKGKSTCYLAEGARLGRGARVIAIDPWNLAGNPDGKHGFHSARAAFEEQTASTGLDARIVALQAFSLDIAAMWAEDTHKVGLLFIDGSHEYDDVAADFYAWLPRMSEYGVIVFDDYKTKRNPGVERLVGELQDRGHGLWSFDEPLAILRLGEVAVCYELTQKGTTYRLTKPAPAGDDAIVYGHGGRLDKDLSRGLPYEAALLEDIETRLRTSNDSSRRTFVDVGAHVGNHTLYLAAVCGFDVVSFEPDERAFRWLQANIDENGLEGYVHAHRVGLADFEGDVAWSDVPGRLELEKSTGFANALVHVKRLDSYGLRDVVGIKIDVEGNECAVLRGAEGTLRRDRPIVWAEAMNDTERVRITEVLWHLDYRLVGIVHTSSPLGVWEPA